MSLQVWLPLCGNIQNYGLADVNVTNSGAIVNTAGKIGSCYYFLRSTPNYLKINNCFTTSGNGISMAFWIKIPSNASGNNQVIHIGNGAGWDNNRCTCFIRTGKSTIVFCCGDGTGTTSTSSTQYNCESSAITLNVWTHVACIYTPGTMQIYLNGVLDKTYTTSIFPSFTNVSYIGVAAAPNGGEPATIYLNDVRIYDHCLSQAEIHEIAKGKMIHLKLANNGFGNPNLITRSTFTSAPWAAAITGTETYKGKDAITVRNSTLYTQTSNGTTSIFPAITFAASTQYTLSLDWCDHLRSDGLNSALYLRFKYSDGTYSNVISPTSNPDANWTHVKLTSTAGKTVAMMTTTYGNGGVVSIANLKLEVGAQETAYSPPTDELDSVEYDCSGYRHDAIKNAITPVFDSARYGAASVFNGSSSYVKVNDNTWMADGLTEFTVSIWMKASSWPSQIRPFCCLESGGFGIGNAGDSGYYRYYVHEYRNADHSSYDYNNDTKALKISDLSTTEWNHLVAVYTTSYTKIYLNGELHHNWTRTSYGIHFNTGARLFLGCEANAASPTTPYFNGQLSDFRLYATALSEEDIKILYHTSGFVDNQGNVFAHEVKEV